MYDYEETSEPLNSFDNVEVFVDTVPTNYPYLPRICSRQGQVFLWVETKDKYPELYETSQNCKDEPQWVVSKIQDNIEMAVALIHVYEDEVIVGCVKTAGYVEELGKDFVKYYVKKVWNDIVNRFNDKTIICPAGSYNEYIHMCMNQMKIPRTPYHKKIMKSFGFVREDNYWIRYGLNNQTD
jgi:hypothetical protein